MGISRVYSLFQAKIHILTGLYLYKLIGTCLPSELGLGNFFLHKGLIITSLFIYKTNYFIKKIYS